MHFAVKVLVMIPSSANFVSVGCIRDIVVSNGKCKQKQDSMDLDIRLVQVDTVLDFHNIEKQMVNHSKLHS